MKLIETERLILRGWHLGDLDDLHEYAKNPNVGTMAGWEPHTDKKSSLKIHKSFINDGNIWAITLNDTGKAIGSLRIYGDENRGEFTKRNAAKLISYALSEDYWDNGYMTEAVKQAVKYAFGEMNAELLTVFYIPQNTRTKRVIVKCGFEYETTIFEGYRNYDGQVFDSIVYSISRNDYFEKFRRFPCPTNSE